MAETVELLEKEYATMVSTWAEPVYLTRRKVGTFTLKVHRRAIGESVTAGQDPLRGMPGFQFGSEAMLEEVETLDARLASEARLLLKARAWCDWDPDVESHRVVMHSLA